ncbi:nucleotide-binding universal stress UspA family protein [Dongia mobilis]|uniref:Nucleotide-binding universal stress UspA family protein n=1 Tax=Dongia mobilis TaxID=578943 RepID=A0A4R6WS84_9PROT|nr:universal stress protein [Dongia mobilis]TDQ82341.1 nucleotide-binding universal stress UspA family protein [Dongia mobilis]
MSVTLDKILCATDGSAPAQKTVVFAVELAQRLALPLSFITITDPKDDPAPIVWDAEAIHAGRLPPDRALLEALQVALKAGIRRIAAVRAPGDEIAQAIVAYAETNSYHHIVMGSEGRTGAKRLLLGSVAADVVNLAHCPVTIVR